MIRRELCIHLCISTKRVKERKYGGRKLKRRLESLHACALQARALGTSAAANFFPMPNQHNEANVKSPGIPRHICSGANERAKKLTVPQCAEPPGGEADGRRSKQEGGAREKGGQKEGGPSRSRRTRGRQRRGKEGATTMKKD
ncbi:unnamed protein product [Prorocentrum cordatum]|uniref:Uncharacterized protein n=1 Tax=Prorocentrum cordatum TaxID=2364126 RepID=A0ABN9PD70_9DINO|nr:unnamed protein product [Polarella glacialis]